MILYFQSYAMCRLTTLMIVCSSIELIVSLFVWFSYLVVFSNDLVNLFKYLKLRKNIGTNLCFILITWVLSTIANGKATRNSNRICQAFQT